LSKIIKTVPNLLTIIRIICAVIILFVEPISFVFWLLYVICGFSDMLDGYIARKTKTASLFGSRLDSIADFVIISVIIIILVPIFSWEPWMLIWIGIIAILRFITFGIGFLRNHRVPWLHTIANKMTGFAMFCFPLIFQIGGSGITVIVICVIASYSAIEELIITIFQSDPNPDVKSIFSAFPVKTDFQA